MQEWRGLTSRKRELLKRNPCRPPLADELEMLTPVLIGRQARLVAKREDDGDSAPLVVCACHEMHGYRDT